MTSVTKDEVLEQLLSDICYEAHKHEVQYWLDSPGTDAEKLGRILKLARDGLAVMQGRLKPQEV